jgi:hypothetical protein
MNGKIRMEGKLHPGNELAIARTVLANQRTMPATASKQHGGYYEKMQCLFLNSGNPFNYIFEY